MPEDELMTTSPSLGTIITSHQTLGGRSAGRRARGVTDMLVRSRLILMNPLTLELFQRDLILVIIIKMLLLKMKAVLKKLKALAQKTKKVPRPL